MCSNFAEWTAARRAARKADILAKCPKPMVTGWPSWTDRVTFFWVDDQPYPDEWIEYVP